MGGRKHIHSDADRANPISDFRNGEGKPSSEEAFACDWTRECEICDQTPVVNATGLCGPCTFGEAKTLGGNW